MPRQLTAEIAGQLLAGKTLKKEQMRAVTEIVTSKDRFVAAHGYAGTGKSYMTMAAKELLESQGLKVTALAPYGTQKKRLKMMDYRPAPLPLSSKRRIKSWMKNQSYSLMKPGLYPPDR